MRRDNRTTLGASGHWSRAVTSGDYLKFLAANGYALAPIEQVCAAAQDADEVFDLLAPLVDAVVAPGLRCTSRRPEPPSVNAGYIRYVDYAPNILDIQHYSASDNCPISVHLAVFFALHLAVNGLRTVFSIKPVSQRRRATVGRRRTVSHAMHTCGVWWCSFIASLMKSIAP